MIKQDILNNKIKVITFDSIKGNMLDLKDIISLTDIITKDKENLLIEGIIITGANSSFCTGVNLSSIDNKPLFYEVFDKLLFDIFSFPKPLVVAATGHSIGGGLLVQVCADIIVMSENMKIKIGLPELKLNAILDPLMISILEYSIGNFRILQELIYTGKYITPSQSLQCHLVDVIVPDKDVFNTALDRLLELMTYDNDFYRETKLSIRGAAMKRCREILAQRLPDL